jgi:hypothetical protein
MRTGRPRWVTKSIATEKIAALAGAGLSDVEIGALYGCPKETIRSRRLRAGIPAGVGPGGQWGSHRGRNKLHLLTLPHWPTLRLGSWRLGEAPQA